MKTESKPRSYLRMLRETRGWTLDYVAELLGLSGPNAKNYVSRHETFARGIPPEIFPKYAAIFGVALDELMKEMAERTDYNSSDIGENTQPQPSVANKPTRHKENINSRTPPLIKETEAFHNDRGIMMPLHSSVQAGAEGAEILPEPIDWTPTPNKLMHVEGAFAITVVGDSMQPKYDDGNIVYVHPHKAPKKGKPCVIQLANGTGLVKIFEGKNDAGWQFSQYNPKMPINKTLAEVVRVMRIVGSMEEE